MQGTVWRPSSHWTTFILNTRRLDVIEREELLLNCAHWILSTVSVSLLTRCQCWFDDNVDLPSVLIWCLARDHRFCLWWGFCDGKRVNGWIGRHATPLHIHQAKLGQDNFPRMMRRIRWRCLIDTGFNILAIVVWGRARYLSVTEAPYWIFTSEWGRNMWFFETWIPEKWNERDFRPPLCTCKLNWARRTSWGWWDDTALQTQDLKFEPCRFEAEHLDIRAGDEPASSSVTGIRRNHYTRHALHQERISFSALSSSIWIFSHLKLCLATAIHNFKRLKITRICKIK